MDGKLAIQEAFLKLDRIEVTGNSGSTRTTTLTQQIPADEPPYRLATGEDSVQLFLSLPYMNFSHLDLRLLLFEDTYQLIFAAAPIAEAPADSEGDVTGDSGDDGHSGDIGGSNGEGNDNGNGGKGSDEGDKEEGADPGGDSDKGDTGGADDADNGQDESNDPEKDQNKDNNKDEEKGTDKDEDKGVGKDEDKGKGKDEEGVGKDEDKGKGRDEDKGKGKDKDEDKEKGKGKDEDKGKGKDADKGKGNDGDKGKGKDEDKGKGKDEDKGKGKDEDNEKGKDKDKNKGKDNGDGGKGKGDDGRMEDGIVNLDHFFQNAKPSVAVFGVYESDGTSVDVLLTVTGPEALTLPVRQNDGFAIQLAENNAAIVFLDPEYLFAALTPQDIETATTQQYQGRTVLFIHRDANTALYEKLLARLEGSIEIIVATDR